jgi:hypothetical protein
MKKRSKGKSPVGPRGGLAYPVDAEWKAEIRSLLVVSGMNQAELARRIKCSPATIVLVLGPDSHTSTLVPAIHRVFGLVPPVRSTKIERITPPITTATA